ncbi:Stk1 family PASTA domain-containing Ser/Thr kinase [Actinomyces slackii]|uniref:non-specific serine/threonine protein kinase n=1 Tax=Actinomyces slackii TaxID=52774 RepID=A0A3S4WIZ4_9ACTO|nr:Stk1 family PASTA domain-containing Ser/Thr kinase [Actinomyces slackii]VEG73953.1 Serine/threonine-protein kinase pknB [Actinomyces slackii]
MTGQFPQVLAGRYEIRDLIGRGGMAEVHLGYDTRLSRWVAIKLLRSDIAGDPTFQARFRREAQSAAALNHPAVVAVYDSGEEELAQPSGAHRLVPYIVMEYVEGHSVRELLSEGEAVPIAEAVEIVSGVLDALEYSHRAGIVHRDIKPGNIMLTSTGAVKVMDFGIARAIEDSASTVTQTHTVVGTAQYLSPEQARGENVDARSDLYSTGCLLYELLTGQPPFQGDSAVAIAYQHVREIPKRPSALAADVPESLDRVILKSLAKNRDDRYQDASHMRTELMAAARGMAVAAPAADSWNEATSVIAPAAAATAAQPAEAAAASEEEEPPKKRTWLWVLAAILLIGAAALAGMWTAGALGGSPAPTPTPSAAAVVIPDVKNMSEAEAKKAIEDLGLVYARAETDVANDEVAIDHAVESNPAANSKVPAGSTVTVTFSGGSAMINDIPDVAGKSQTEARQILEDAGLTVGNSTSEDHPTVPKDHVIRTDPSKGPVQRGSSVSLVLSTGETTVPDLLGMTQEEARQALSDAGLSVGNVTYEESSDYPEGQVARHSPNKGGQVDQGSEVDIVISSGSKATASPTPQPSGGASASQQAQVTVPDVTGKSLSDAVAALQSAGLEVESEGDQVPSDSVPEGNVISSSPGAGSQVAPGSKVRLTVSSGPNN